MKIYQAIKVKNPPVKADVNETSAPETKEEAKAEQPSIPAPDVVEDVKKVINKGLDVVGNNVEAMMGQVDESLKNIFDLIGSSSEQKAPDWYDLITLSDDEMLRVQNYMMDVKKKYFPKPEYNFDEDQISKPYLWTMPRGLYMTFTTMMDRLMPDYLNPMFWVTVSLLKTDGKGETYSKALLTAINNTTAEEMSQLYDLAGMDNPYDEEPVEGLEVLENVYENDDEDYSEEDIRTTIDVPPMTEETFQAEEADPENIEIDVTNNNDVSSEGEMTELNDDMPPEEEETNNDTEETNNEKPDSSAAQSAQ